MSVANKTRALLNVTGHKVSELSGCLEKYRVSEINSHKMYFQCQI